MTPKYHAFVNGPGGYCTLCGALEDWGLHYGLDRNEQSDEEVLARYIRHLVDLCRLLHKEINPLHETCAPNIIIKSLNDAVNGFIIEKMEERRGE